jgi:hypothetical protein
MTGANLNYISLPIVKKQNLLQLTFVGNGKLFPAFSASRCEHCPAIASFHALSEPMNSFSPPPVRLKCTFHDLLF